MSADFSPATETCPGCGAVLAPVDDAWQVVAVLAPPGQSR